MAILCGSLVAACSGTIDTPTNEFPARQSSASDDSDSDSDSDSPTAAANSRPTPPPAAPAPADDDEEEEEEDPAPAAAAGDDEDPPLAAGSGSTTLSFEEDVWPIFQDSCGPCHVSIGSGNQNIGSDDLEIALEDSLAFEDAVIEEMEEGKMPIGCSGPPGSAGCVTEEEFTTIQDWYAAGAQP